MNFLEEVAGLLPNHKLEAVVDMIVGCRGRVWLIGNGASAAIASHTAVYLTKACAIPAMTFHDPVLMTCLTNDYGTDDWMRECVKSYVRTGDLLICISSSGESNNVVNATPMNDFDNTFNSVFDVITLTGFSPNNRLRERGDINLWVDSSNYNVVESVHFTWLACVIEMITGGL